MTNIHRSAPGVRGSPGGWRSAPGRRHAGGVVLAAFLAVGLSLSPAASAPVAAAGTLRLEADTTYTLDPEAGRVHVAIDVTATSLKPNSASFIFFYREIAFPLQGEASKIRATDRLGAISITTRKREFYVEATVRLRAPIYYRDSDRFTIRYDLVGGAPRSDSPTRVGRAFATFGVWSWGDAGRSTVTVKVPAGFTSHVEGAPLATQTNASGQTLSASPRDPDTFYSIVSAENRDAYSDTRMSFEGGVEIVVLAWPEDHEWNDTVGATLRRAIPELRRLIGLDWPVAHDLNVRERYTPALEGYAGLFFTDDQRIDVSEDLDPVVIVHEASHAWFNEDLFTYRWIYEGLAEEYAWRVQTAVGGENLDLPEVPDPDDAGALALSVWTFPDVIREDVDDTEIYGYQASFWLMHLIVETAGEDQMRAAFANAQANLTAYQGIGAPETVDRVDGWRRFLDLTEPLDAPDPEAVIEAVKDYVLGDFLLTELSDRRHAREDYRELLADAAGWTPPWYIREPMGKWLFREATPRMAEATALLARRDAVAASAADLDLEPDGALRAAYEGASDGDGEGFVGAETLAADQLAALAAIGDARSEVAAAPDFLTQLGLIGETPNAPYEAARGAFEAGDLDAAVRSAAAASSLISGAAAIGQQRLIVGLAVAAGVILLLIVVALLLRRRRRRRRALALAPAHAAFAPMPDAPSETPEAVALTPAAPAVAPEPYATLAADPATAPALTPPPPSASPPDDLGGPADGDSPANP